MNQPKERGTAQVRVSIDKDLLKKVTEFSQKEARPVSNAMGFLVMKGLEVVRQEEGGVE